MQQNQPSSKTVIKKGLGMFDYFVIYLLGNE